MVASNLAFLSEAPEPEDGWILNPYRQPRESSFRVVQETGDKALDEALVSASQRRKAPAFRSEERAPDVDFEFRRLVEEWRTAILLSSSMTEMCMHHAYQRIIGLGMPAVPLLLRELRLNPDHWFWALYAITGANPVDPADAGDLVAMTEAWIRWGRDHGYI